MQKRLELTRVQMPPDTRLGMIAAGQLTPADRARPPYAGAMLDADVHPPVNSVQLDSLDKPGLGQAENPRIQVRVLHGCPPRRTLVGKLPTEKPEGPGSGSAACTRRTGSGACPSGDRPRWRYPASRPTPKR